MDQCGALVQLQAEGPDAVERTIHDIEKICQLFLAGSSFELIEINPLTWVEDRGPVALDAAIRLVPGTE